ncbi:hypothetical protein ACFYXC_34010 [Streptomyces sp. NPDC002701]|uniref:hypothetical protein n=1 Tax=Streptomyces sp. NPDC002701 TaxID=3364661 RepID=UPI0036A5550F
MWNARLGDVFPLPRFSRATISDFRVRTRAARVRGVVFTDIHGASAMRTDSSPDGI